MPEVYEMDPVSGGAFTYEMEPASGGWEVYQMETDEDATGYVFFNTIYFPGGSWNLNIPYIGEPPQYYGLNEQLTFNGQIKSVKVVYKSGVFQITADSKYTCDCHFATASEGHTIGTGNTYNTSVEAIAGVTGQSYTLEIGPDNILAWGSWGISTVTGTTSYDLYVEYK